jgi:ATP-binding protein involved in chromosome partitioning
MLHGAVQQFMRDVRGASSTTWWSTCRPARATWRLSMAQSVPVAGRSWCTTPQGVSVSDVRKAVGMFRQLNIPPAA